VCPRLFDQGGEVLIGGIRRPLAGVVTMDQIVVDCGPVGSAPVAVGDEAVLLGRQGAAEITATEWADLLAPSATRSCATSGPGARQAQGSGTRPRLTASPD